MLVGEAVCAEGAWVADDLLSNREAIDVELRKIMDEQTEPWGIQVSKVILKDVELPEELKRDMARRTESERASRRASGSA